jgi:hypothetical protein
MSMNSLALLALLATASPDDAPSAPPSAADLASKAYSENLGKQLRASTSPRERALGARMYFDDPTSAGKVLREAAKAAPNDVLVQLQWSTIGSAWSGCDAASPCPEQAMAWARVEPDNGLAWLPAFEALYRSGDERAIDAAIAHMAGAGSFDDHFVDAWLAFRGAIAARAMTASVAKRLLASEDAGDADPRQAASDVMAMAYAAALPLPLTGLSRSCKRESHPQLAPARFEDCARIGRAIVHSDSSVMMKMLGMSIVHVSGLEDDSDRQARRALAWRQQSSVAAMNRPSGAKGYFADLASTRSEVRAQELLMARSGIAPEPPPEWQDPRGD